MKKIVLVGFATSGKSTVGKLLAERLNAEFVDTDVEIERECGLTIQQIFATFGESYFREKENELLLSLSNRRNVVVACGGGSVTVEGFDKLAASGTVIWLTATAATVKRRLGNTSRPLFDGLDGAQLEEFVNARAPFYQRYATVTVSTDELTPEQIVAQIISFC